MIQILELYLVLVELKKSQMLELYLLLGQGKKPRTLELLLPSLILSQSLNT